VSLALELRAVQAAVPPGLAELEDGLARIAERVTGVFDQVREISHGIHPAILSERGLPAALKALARRSAVPVELELRTRRRLPGHVEVAAYYAVSEALANAVKHAALRSCTSNSTRWTRSCGWRSATTGSGEPTPPRGPD
jgi:signal transduction histidine kinase